MTTKLEITPLMEACQNSNSDDVEALISKGVKKNLNDPKPP